MDSLLSGVFLLLITLTVIIFAYYTTVIIGKKTNMLVKNRYIQILEKASIGLNTSIEIIKINKKIYIIAIQGKSIELLDVIDEADWEFIVIKNENPLNIKEQMNNIVKDKLKKK